MTNKENRRNPRRNIRIPVFCWKIEDDRQKDNGIEIRTKDISAEGLAFYSSQIYSINTILIVDIFLPNQKKPISCKLKVVSLETTANKEEYVIGASLFDLQSKDRLLLASAVDKMDLYLLLESVLAGEASDLHLTIGRPPMVRRNGRILPMAAEVIEEGQVEAMLYPLLTQEQIAYFESNKELDFAFSPNLNSRFRVNLHKQKGYVEAVLRSVPTVVKIFEDLGLPVEAMQSFCHVKSGLILIAGKTGGGKTTTLSAMVNYINQHQEKVIITVEDPIEYIFKSEKSIVRQRELGTDTRSYAEALRRGLRQDPDVICVGEILNSECLMAAMRAAETGHVVITTVHAPDTVSAIERIVNLFQSEHAVSVRQQLSSCLVGILAQKLLPAVQDTRVLATELLLNNSAIKHLIREGQYSQIGNILQTSRAVGMQTFQASVNALYEEGLIDEEVKNEFTIEIKS